MMYNTTTNYAYGTGMDFIGIIGTVIIVLVALLSTVVTFVLIQDIWFSIRDYYISLHKKAFLDALREYDKENK